MTRNYSFYTSTLFWSSSALLYVVAQFRRWEEPQEPRETHLNMGRPYKTLRKQIPSLTRRHRATHVKWGLKYHSWFMLNIHGRIWIVFPKIHLLGLRQQVVQVVPPLVVKVEVLALRLALGAHHLSNGWPVPAVLHQPCRGKETLYE